jgi:transcription-repair coupling factor (superfamily II helicase)
MERLFEVMQIKVLAKALKLEYVEVRGGLMNLRFHEQAKLPEQGLRSLMESWKDRLEFLSPRACRLTLPEQDWAAMYPRANTILQDLYQSMKQEQEAVGT